MVLSESGSSSLAFDGTSELPAGSELVSTSPGGFETTQPNTNSSGRQPSIISADSANNWTSETDTAVNPEITGLSELGIWGGFEEGALTFQNSQSSTHQALDFAPAEIAPWSDLIMPIDYQLQNRGEPTSMGMLALPNAQVDADGFFSHRQSFQTQSRSGSHPNVDSPPSNHGESLESIPYTDPSDLNLRYPVLHPLLKYISKFMDSDLACDLLDYYFIDTTNSNFLVKPHSPYVLSHIFRKQTFLDPQYPRPTSPALLCAILYCALKTIDIADLQLTTNAKAKISKGLWETCLHLLGPFAPEAVRNGGETHFRMSDEIASEQLYENEGSVEQDISKCDLDTFISILHIGTVVAAGHFKGDSPVWWQQSLDLALKLGLNVCSDPPASSLPLRDRRSLRMAKEMKEERCRAWWLLYLIDRHIALSLNRQLLIDQAAGDGLQLPLEDSVWQGSGFAFISDSQRLYAPSYQMTGIGLFGYFLPLMRIMGDIINYHHSQYDNHQPELKVHLANVLAVYEQSAYDLFELLDRSVQPIDMVRSILYDDSNIGTDPHLMPRIVFYYSIHLVHVLYILLYGKWDPIVMLEEPGPWLNSPDFIVCAQHAVAAAKTVSQILALDPELNFIPYLWGIYLLQGSFMLLVFAESMKFGERASPQTIADCETIVHAHEVCVATLSTEYQVP